MVSHGPCATSTAGTTRTQRLCLFLVHVPCEMVLGNPVGIYHGLRGCLAVGCKVVVSVVVCVSGLLSFCICVEVVVWCVAAGECAFGFFGFQQQVDFNQKVVAVERCSQGWSECCGQCCASLLCMMAWSSCLRWSACGCVCSCEERRFRLCLPPPCCLFRLLPPSCLVRSGGHRVGKGR